LDNKTFDIIDARCNHEVLIHFCSSYVWWTGKQNKMKWTAATTEVTDVSYSRLKLLWQSTWGSTLCKSEQVVPDGVAV